MYELLDKLVSEFIEQKENKYILENIDKYVIICENILKENNIKQDSIIWSRKVTLNDSINNIYKFLSDFNKDIANQFLNIIYSKDKNNKPYVMFRDKSKYPNTTNEAGNGFVHISYEENPNDMFNILHEVLHYMNQSYIIIDNNNIYNLLIDKLFKRYIKNNVSIDENVTRKVYGEAVSITAEKIFADYLLKNNLINENDLLRRRQERQKYTKMDSEAVLITLELIKIKLSNKSITEDNIINHINSYKNSDENIYQILTNIFNNKDKFQIVDNNKLNINERLRYVIAKTTSDGIIKSKNPLNQLFKLHNEVGNVNSNIYEVEKNINKL